MTDRTLELVTWDLDGTLYDAEALRAEVRRRMTRAVRPRTWRSTRDAARALRLHRQHDRRLRATEGAVDAEARAFWGGPVWGGFVQDFLLPSLRAVGPHPRAVQLVERVRVAGVRQVVVSDHRVPAKLAALGLEHAFAAGYAGVELGALKPHPSVFRAVLHAEEVSPARVLHVGDRDDTDGRAARGAGLRFAHVQSGDYVPVEHHLARAGLARAATVDR